ncbi:hemerythrin domain-containing protein [Adhaeribacter rhizoryzae]|uniref:Hemerythrin domain-containing protein n=1 Tax=Adhaeribacter rhizoryzae TaxID=2607907 RepID=A0A5M6D2S4_9BACT|nr:hemerythrin domain-containing protein [Adhaeribacter rhizoryzae]KAA5539969.1 hemerythrin domain-containing protein [Adhaeribacter rhizoryzae]
METIVQPLKRHPELVGLSREHHFELLFAWKIKQGLARKVDSHIIQDYIRYFWDNHLENHLEKEEKIVVQVLSEADPMRFRVQQDHDLIRSVVNYLSCYRENIDYVLNTLQILVKEHVRFEERIFFPYLEQVATPGQLILIGLEMDKYAVEPTDDFEPAFWLSQPVEM